MAIRVSHHQLVDTVTVILLLPGHIGNAGVKSTLDPGHFMVDMIADLVGHLAQVFASGIKAVARLLCFPINVKQLERDLIVIGAFFKNAPHHQSLGLNQAPVLVAHLADLARMAEKIPGWQQVKATRAVQVGSDNATQILRRISRAMPAKRHHRNRDTTIFSLGNLYSQYGVSGQTYHRRQA